MPTYVYGCDSHPDERREVIRSFTDNPYLPCPVCQKPMHRIPQMFKWGRNAGEHLLEKMSDRFKQIRARKRAIKQWQQNHRN